MTFKINLFYKKRKLQNFEIFIFTIVENYLISKKKCCISNMYPKQFSENTGAFLKWRLLKINCFCKKRKTAEFLNLFIYHCRTLNMLYNFKEENKTNFWNIGFLKLISFAKKDFEIFIFVIVKHQILFVISLNSKISKEQNAKCHVMSCKPKIIFWKYWHIPDM